MQKIIDYLEKYNALFIIIIFCLVLSFITKVIAIDKQTGDFMQYFMAYFFILFSLFKFLDIKGFVEGFKEYDILAKKYSIYGYCYPFIELTIGIAYLSGFMLIFTNILTFLLMTISGIGVIKSLLSGKKMRCACLGTVLNVPLSVISVIENFGMGAMSFYNIVF